MTISRDEHKAIIDDQLDGKVQILIDTSIWRQFLCQTDSREFGLLVERSVVAPIALIRFLSWVWIPLLLACAGISIPALGWWSLAVCPIILLGGFLYKSRASAGRQSLAAVTVFLIAALVLMVLWPSWSLSLRLLLVSVAVSLFLIRFLYVFTSRFVFGLIHSSYEFFSRFYLKPAEKVGDVVIPLIWTEPEWEKHHQEPL
jgi:hypothetical protein